MAQPPVLIDFTIDLRELFALPDDDITAESSKLHIWAASSRLRSLIETHCNAIHNAETKEDAWELLAHQTAHALVAASTAYPAKVDALIEIFMSALADADPAQGHDEEIGVREKQHYGQSFEDWSETHPARLWARHALRATAGRRAFFLENLAQTLGMEPLATLQQMTHNDPSVYQDATHRLTQLRLIYGPTILLARLFATQPVARPYLWREVEEVLIKTAMSVRMKEAGCYLALPIMIEGAARAIDDWTKYQGKGVGKNWVAWLGVCTSPLERWIFLEVMDDIIADGYESRDAERKKGLTDDLISLRMRAVDLAFDWTTYSREDSPPPTLDSATLDKEYGWAVRDPTEVAK